MIPGHLAMIPGHPEIAACPAICGFGTSSFKTPVRLQARFQDLRRNFGTKAILGHPGIHRCRARSPPVLPERRFQNSDFRTPIISGCAACERFQDTHNFGMCGVREASSLRRKSARHSSPQCCAYFGNIAFLISVPPAAAGVPWRRVLQWLADARIRLAAGVS